MSVLNMNVKSALNLPGSLHFIFLQDIPPCTYIMADMPATERTFNSDNITIQIQNNTNCRKNPLNAYKISGRISGSTNLLRPIKNYRNLY